MDNRQALGYMLLACKRLGYTKIETKSMYGAMHRELNLKTESEAEVEGRNWYLDLKGVNPSKMKWASPSKKIISPIKNKMSLQNKELLKKIREYKNSL